MATGTLKKGGGRYPNYILIGIKSIKCLERNHRYVIAQVCQNVMCLYYYFHQTFFFFFSSLLYLKEQNGSGT